MLDSLFRLYFSGKTYISLFATFDFIQQCFLSHSKYLLRFFSSSSLFSSLSWEYVHNDKPGKMWMRSNDYKPFYTCCQFSFKIKLPHTHTQSIIWHNILLALHTCFVSIFIYFFFSFLFSRGKSSVFPFSFFVAFFFIELDGNLSCKKWWLYPF